MVAVEARVVNITTNHKSLNKETTIEENLLRLGMWVEDFKEIMFY